MRYSHSTRGFFHWFRERRTSTVHVRCWLCLWHSYERLKMSTLLRQLNTFWKFMNIFLSSFSIYTKKAQLKATLSLTRSRTWNNMQQLSIFNLRSAAFLLILKMLVNWFMNVHRKVSAGLDLIENNMHLNVEQISGRMRESTWYHTVGASNIECMRSVHRMVTTKFGWLHTTHMYAQAHDHPITVYAHSSGHTSGQKPFANTL